MNDVRLVIDLDAVASNHDVLARMAHPARLGAVVKADAYGLGCGRIVPVLLGRGCRTFFVATMEEARQLVPQLPDDATAFVLNGFAPQAANTAYATGATPVVNTLTQLVAWHALAIQRGRKLPLALQLDTGMSRLGLAAAEVDAVAQRSELWRMLDLRLVMTHLASADEMASPANTRQRQCFAVLADRLPAAPRSIANSAGVSLGDGFRGDLVRAGIALYGGRPVDGMDAIRPVVSVAARIIQLRTIAAGTAVGYGGQFTADTPRRIATLGIGYADGIPRALGGRGHAWIGGQRVPIVGRVSMDSLALDVSDLPHDAVDEQSWATLLGDQQGIDALGTAAGTIGYEILTRLGRRAARCYRVPACDANARICEV